MCFGYWPQLPHAFGLEIIYFLRAGLDAKLRDKGQAGEVVHEPVIPAAELERILHLLPPPRRGRLKVLSDLVIAVEHQ
jgi:hypothetical protein